MKAIHNYRLEDETFEEQFAARRHNPAQVLVVGDRRFSLGAGTSDDIHAFEHEQYIYVVSMNTGLDYVGLQIFAPDDSDAGEIFLQGEWEYREILGPRGLDLSPRTIANRLQEYCYSD
jgi:hypothetical protein